MRKDELEKEIFCCSCGKVLGVVKRSNPYHYVGVLMEDVYCYECAQ